MSRARRSVEGHYSRVHIRRHLAVGLLSALLAGKATGQSLPSLTRQALPSSFGTRNRSCETDVALGAASRQRRYFALSFSLSFATSSGRTGSVMRAGSRISLICSSLRYPLERAISMMDLPVATDSLAISAAFA